VPRSGPTDNEPLPILPSDLVRYVNRQFPEAERSEALSLLAEAQIHDGKEASIRLKRCAAVGAQGSLKGLRDMIALLMIDWRDVIVCGEYSYENGEPRQVRDLTKPIGPSV
jgi:hypothetical protein